MTVDCITYLFNFCAERFKHKPLQDYGQLSPYERHYRKKMRLLLLELAPPLISVTTLVVVTIMALGQAITILLDTDPNIANNNPQEQPDLMLMLLFSAFNFLLDGVNVVCFAKADQAKGLSEGFSAAIRPSDQ